MNKSFNITTYRFTNHHVIKLVFQADVEVSFSLTNLSEIELIDSEAIDPQLLCSQKNASISGRFGPFGLLILASKNLTEQTAVFFRVFKGPNKFLVLMCSDQSRLAPNILTD